MKNALIALLPLALLPATASAARYELDELEELLGKAAELGGTYSFSHFSTEVDGHTASSRGSLQFLKPDKYRIVYSDPQDFEVVSNGEDLWVHDPLLKQVIVSSSDAAEEVSGFLAVLANGGDDEALTKRIEVSEDGDTSWLVLVPDNPDQYQFLECLMAFDEQGRIEEVRFVNLLGTEVQAQFEIVAAGGLAPGDFEFSIPSGTEVIRE